MPLTEAFVNFQITQRVTGGARLAVNGNVKLPGEGLPRRPRTKQRTVRLQMDVIISRKNDGIIMGSV